MYDSRETHNIRRVIGKFLNWGKLEKLLVFWFLHRNKQHLNSYDAPNQLLARLRSVPLAQITPLTPDFQWKRWEPWEGQFSNFNFNCCFVENASMKSFITEYCALAVHLRWNYAIQIEKKNLLVCSCDRYKMATVIGLFVQYTTFNPACCNFLWRNIL